MPRPCTICNHPSRAAIERALVAGETVRNVAERFDTTHTALLRHRANHLADRLARARQLAAAGQHTEDQRLVAQQEAQRAGEAALDLDVLAELQRCLKRLIRMMDA